MLDFIVNPSAGKKDKKIQKALPKIEKYLVENGFEYVIHTTKMPHHATTLTENLISNGATNIIVVGGDGTLSEVINGFSNFDKVAMGIIPCGTGNDFASSLNLPLDPVEALKIILENKPKYADFMQMPTIRGLNIIGMGIDVDVIKKYSKLKRKTKFAYTKCLIKSLLNFEYSEFEAEFNGENKEYRSFLACVANGKCFGGGIPICPVADPTDHKLDFVAVREMKKLKIVSSFVKLKKGKLFELKEAIHATSDYIKIKAKGHYTVNVDGELFDDIPFEVKLIKDTLRVYY